jgi:hypothetical protein
MRETMVVEAAAAFYIPFKKQGRSTFASSSRIFPSCIAVIG